MPLGILSEEEFEQELEIAKNNGKSKLPARIEIVERGRGHKEETPESARKLIAEMAIEGNDISSITENFNVSPSSVSAYKHGATSCATYNQPEKELLKHNNAIRDRIIRKARKKLILAVDGITESKIADLGVKDCATVAKDMSTVIKNLEPEIKPEIDVKAQFIFYAPQVKTEVDYEVIDVSE